MKIVVSRMIGDELIVIDEVKWSPRTTVLDCNDGDIMIFSPDGTKTYKDVVVKVVKSEPCDTLPVNIAI